MSSVSVILNRLQICLTTAATLPQALDQFLNERRAIETEHLPLCPGSEPGEDRHVERMEGHPMPEF